MADPVKTCVICGAALGFGKRRYCSKRCYHRSKRPYNLARYQNDPVFAAHKRAYGKAWREAHPELVREQRRARYLRDKAARLEDRLKGEG